MSPQWNVTVAVLVAPAVYQHYLALLVLPQGLRIRSRNALELGPLGNLPETLTGLLQSQAMGLPLLAQSVRPPPCSLLPHPLSLRHRHGREPRARAPNPMCTWMLKTRE